MSRPHGEEKGYLALILHAHLPFVRHPENRHHLEELWLFEAITDTYLPLLDLMEGWVEDGIPFHLTMSITPPLASMLADPLLQRRYVEHLERSIALAHREMRRTQHQPHVHRLARMYRDRFLHARKAFLQRYHADLLNAFSRFRAHGLELIASAATHALLPLTEPHISAAAAQIRAGVEHHRQVFRETPCGFWLPECGYSPNLDRLLVEEGIRYTIVDTHGVLHARPRPLYAVYSPVYTPRGLAVFGRDVETSKQVWSATEGYPGDPVYREFYRDIGYDLPWEELAPYLPWGVRADTGFKYYRVTGRTHHKEVYDPDIAQERAREHARNFVFNRIHQIRYLARHMDRKPIVVAPYDAELFGHWWFEGPWFLDEVVRHIHRNQHEFCLTTPKKYLEEHPTHQVVEVATSTWGYMGYFEVWLNGSNDWIYRHLHEASRRMQELAEAFEHPTPLEERALNQAARELMLAQSSDWAFIMKTKTVVEYAVRRTKEHLHRFFLLADQLEHRSVDASFLAALESRDNLLPWVDFRSYRSAPALPTSRGESAGAAGTRAPASTTLPAFSRT
ncbi:MAG TPA: 1,4-alpha-glucan branching protein domain-containing protein [Limnochordia bacterium]|nr:1,4-alpha-glucan branching protein domain-containing protein [Limnochordia bacterium]